MKENQYFKTEYFLNEMRGKKEAFTKGGKDPAVLYKLSYLSKNIAGTCRNVLDVGCGIGDLYHYMNNLIKTWNMLASTVQK